VAAVVEEGNQFPVGEGRYVVLERKVGLQVQEGGLDEFEPLHFLAEQKHGPFKLLEAGEEVGKRLLSEAQYVLSILFQEIAEVDLLALGVDDELVLH
jgi:hypothetical protein